MEKVKIAEVCKISNGFAFKSDKYVNSDGGRIIRITNVQKGKIVDNDPKLYPFFELKNLENYKIDEGDIMMSLTGNVGRVGIFPKELLPAYINQRVCRIKSKTKKLLDNYLFHFLNSDIFENEAVRNSAGAAQLNLSTNWLAAYEMPLPPLPTQQKIAAILDKADELRQYNKQLIEKYEALTQSLFLDMFGDPVKNEKGWEKSKLSDNSKIRIGPFGSLLHVEDYIENGIPLVNPTHIKNGKIEINNKLTISKDKIKELETYRLKTNDLILGRRGEMGRCAIVTINEDGFLCGTGSIFIRPKNNLNINYLYKVISSNSFRQVLENSAKGVTMKNLNSKVVGDLDIPLPTIEIQNNFIKSIENIENQKQQAQEALSKSEDLFQSLLQRAFRGELN